MKIGPKKIGNSLLELLLIPTVTFLNMFIQYFAMECKVHAEQIKTQSFSVLTFDPWLFIVIRQWFPNWG